MNKKQVFAVSLVAAIPAIGLAVFLGIGLTHMISDGANVSVLLWIIWGLAMLGALVIGFLPFAILMFKGLLPEPGLAMAGAGAGVAAAGGAAAASRTAPASDDVDEDYADDEESSYSDEDEEYAEEEGESLFEDGVEDDFDDDFEDFDSRK